MAYSTDFLFGVIDNPDLEKEAFRLRYQVYCRECNFIKEEDCPQGFEKDKFDPYSVSFFAKDSRGMVGTVRLVLHSHLGFPLEERCKHSLFVQKHALSRNKFAEISRLAISKELLYKKTKKHFVPNRKGLFPRFKPLILGIFNQLYKESRKYSIDYVYAMMEKPLFLLLKKQGFTFHPIGKEIDFYGPVRPYLGLVKDLGRNIIQKDISSLKTKD